MVETQSKTPTGQIMGRLGRGVVVVVLASAALGIYSTFGQVGIPPLEPRLPPLPAAGIGTLFRTAESVLLARVTGANRIEQHALVLDKFSIDLPAHRFQIFLSVDRNLNGRCADHTSLQAYAWEAEESPRVLDAGKNPGALENVQVGDLSLYFVTCAGDVLRPVFDVIRSRVPVSTGITPDEATELSGSEEDVAAKILLRPGRRFSARYFRPDQAIRAAIQIAGYEKTRRVLVDVLDRSGDGALTRGLCNSAGDVGIFGVDRCLLYLSEVFAANHVEVARDLGSMKLSEGERDLKVSAQSNFSTWFKRALPVGADAVDYLRMLTHHPDGLIRSRASEMLDQFEPHDGLR